MISDHAAQNLVKLTTYLNPVLVSVLAHLSINVLFIIVYHTLKELNHTFAGCYLLRN